jgi:hypothetical protein
MLAASLRVMTVAVTLGTAPEHIAFGFQLSAFGADSR